MTKKLFTILVLLFIMNVFNNLGHPVTPSFVRQLNIPDYFFGIFYATMSFGMMISAPIWGTLGDQGKNKYFIALGLIIYATAQLGFSLSHNAYMMILFRLIGGIGIAAPMTLFISLIIGHSQLKRIKYLGIAAALSTLGTSLGYQIGGILGDSDFFNKLIPTNSYENIFILQSSLMILLSISSLLLVKDYEKDISIQKRKNPFKSLSHIKEIDYKLLIFLISLTLITMGSTNLSKYIDVYFSDLGLSTTTLGNHVLLTGVISVLTAVLIVPIVSKFKRQLPLIILLQILSALIIFYVFRAENFILMIYTVYNIYIIFKATYLPLEQNYITQNVNSEMLGTMTGVRQSFISIGNVIGPLIGGVIYGIKPLLLFDTSALLFLLGAGLLIFVLFTKRQK